MQAVDCGDGGPIACTLSAAEVGPRLARIQALTRQHLREHQQDGSTLRLTYALKAADELSQIVQLERECCAFLDFRLRQVGDDVQLVITAPDQDGTDAKWLFSQFLPEPQVAAAACACCKR